MNKIIRGNIGGANVKFTAKSTYDEDAMNFAIKAQFGIDFLYLGNKKHFDDDTKNRDVWIVKFWRGEYEFFTLEYGQSIADRGKKPSYYDVLACITKYNPGSFDDFCSDYGYDIDSKQAEKTYNSICDEWKKISKFFNAEQIELLSEIN